METRQGPGRPKGSGHRGGKLVALWLWSEHLEAVRHWCEAHDCNRSEAMREMIIFAVGGEANSSASR